MIEYTSRKTMLSFNYHKVEKGVAIMIKVALKNGYTVYGRLIEENSSSIILVAQREPDSRDENFSYPLFKRHRRENRH